MKTAINPQPYASDRILRYKRVLLEPGKTLVAALLLFLALTLLLVTYQYHAKNLAYKEQLQSLKVKIEDFVQTQANELINTDIALDQTQSEANPMLIKSLSLAQKNAAFVALGTAQEWEPAQISAWLADKYQEGYENLTLSRFAQDDQTTQAYAKGYVIDQVFPFKPKTQALLGKTLSDLPNFQTKLAAMLQQKNAQSLLVHLFNEPLMIIIWHHEPLWAQIEKELIPTQSLSFSAYHVQSLLSSLLEKNLGDDWVQANLISSQLDQYTFSPAHSAPNTMVSMLASHHELTLNLLNTPFQLKIDYLAWQNLPWIQLLLIAFLTTLALIATWLVFKAYNDYTQHLKLEGNRLNEFMAAAHDAIILTDETGLITNWNPSAATLFGYRHAEAVGKTIQNLIVCNESEDILKSADLFNKKSFKAQSKLQKRNLNIINCEIAVSKLTLDARQELAFFIEDISERHSQEEEIKRLAFYDSLTGLENRTYFSNKVTEILSEGLGLSSALLFIDLDGFKKVNDSLGHSVGDELLKIVALRFQNAIRGNQRNTHLCRFGGDEFLFFLDNVTPNAAQITATRIIEQLQKVIKIDDHEIQISCSVGIASYPQHGQDLDTLMRHADSAMYHSKFKGKNTFTLYEDRMEEKLSQHLLIEKHLRFALNHDEFELFYQPQIETQSLKVIGVEALIRWNSKDLGFVPPDMFISIAEESGQILAIGDWVIQAAIKQLLAWQNTDLANLQIAINISAQQLEQKNLADKLHEALQTAKLPSHLLEVELTERSIMSNAQSNIELFNDIRARGLSLSVDDFGTGYSSLSYLKRFPLNILKVDKSFVDGLPGDEDDVSISRSIIQLAHSLKMKVVAEGVETLEQFEFLREHECDMVQGYFFSKPINAQQFEAWYAQHHDNIIPPKALHEPIKNPLV
ncbi:sensor domain-containing protein [Thiosulfativibrio zosterae]|uniref:cyclic-guanylate-specific phosphodiesterase n=1 Tax=Thiosulfativibrio zosterae TaxID=2675053 RepID=A0A6F8PKE2_9GAMM|nr:EAL domain-containing protein [Thiosulfativibrio zosterae]BBP42573.1 hypothetical protein THMIRHAT_03190 [Thiosulfativibrio zosterae]